MDDLSKPLGQEPSKKRRFDLAALAGRTAAALLGAAVLAFVLWASVAHDPLGGEPRASASISQPASDEPKVATKSPQAPQQQPVQPQKPGTQTITIIDGASGKRQEIVVPSQAEGRRSAADPRLLEPSRHGPIPRIAPDGTRPAEIYARAARPERGNPDGPQVAIVVGGLGVSTSGTAAALAKLPGAVSVAFTPYGNGLDALVARAREKGHEVLLQIPMEPYDYPDNDPGPQTLLSSLSAEQNVDRLHWLFSRIQGYVGIVNFMGARFTASDAALAPVLREVAIRGLIYVDDGSSPRSQAGQIAGANKLPFVKADVVIDAVPGAAEIDSALKRLEAAAQRRGLAIGFSSALPASIDRIAKWAKGAEQRGLVLVPVSAAALRAQSS